MANVNLIKKTNDLCLCVFNCVNGISVESCFMSMQMRRVLSVQSHVVSGYVGNKSAVFPLQLLGFEVDPLNTVQFSNHTGYTRGCKGQVLDNNQLDDLLDGLEANELDKEYAFVATGFVGNESFLKHITNMVKGLKAKNQGLMYICDPVLGDFGPGLYVPKGLIDLYREQVVNIADVVVPNQFEAQLITGIDINDEQDAKRAMEWFHGRGVSTVVLSSFETQTEKKTESPTLISLASTVVKDKMEENNRLMYRIEFPKLPASFVGTGDLFSALTLAWLAKSDFRLDVTLEKAVATIQQVLKVTMELSKSDNHGDSAKRLELRLVQAQECVKEPNVIIKAQRI